MGRPKGALNKATKEIRHVAQAMLEDGEYRVGLIKRLAAGKAPHMEVLLHHYAYGKPSEHVELDQQGAIVVKHLYASASHD